MRYTSYQHGQLIQSAGADSQEIYFITAGCIAICETTSFKEPIMVQRPGSLFNVYQILLETNLDFDIYAVSQ